MKGKRGGHVCEMLTLLLIMLRSLSATGTTLQCILIGSKKKLPYINMWGNLCLGDLKRFTRAHNYRLPKSVGKTYADANKTNATAELFSA